MGTVEAIYPHLAESGDWFLEYRLTSDTVFVKYEEARDKVSDPSWKEALTSGSLTFYADGSECMYTRTVTGCLAFLEESELP